MPILFTGNTKDEIGGSGPRFVNRTDHTRPKSVSTFSEVCGFFFYKTKKKE